jgi:hypothetical protein
MIEPPTGLNEADFESIEAAVMETARGRWFLAEYARRCRAEDNARLLSAVDRLENAAAAARAEEASARLSADRAEGLVRQLAELLQTGQNSPLGREESTAPASDGEPSAPRTPAKGSIEARLQALVRFDRLPLAQKLQLLG